MGQRFAYVWVFVIEADKMDLKTAAHCKKFHAHATRTL